MESEPTVLDSLRKAVEAMPDDVPLRLHLATLLLTAGQRDEGVRHLGAVLQRDPGNAQALGLLREPAEPDPGLADPGLADPGRADPGRGDPGRADPGRADPGRADPGRGEPGQGDLGQAGEVDRAGGVDRTGQARGAGQGGQYDWSQAEDELRDVLPAMFVGDEDGADPGIEEADAFDAEHAGLTLADVAG